MKPQPYLIAILPLLVCGCSRPQAQAADVESQAEAATKSQTSKDPVLVRVSPLSVGKVENRLEATATVQSLDVVEVMPERAEPVVAILVEEGDQVQAGQVLAQLRDDVARLEVAEAEVRVVETRQAMEQAQREFERDKSLMESGGATGVLSDRDLETRRQTWEASKTAHQTAKVAYDRALLGLKQCTIQSPIDGTVSARDISLGDMTAPGTRVFQITDLSHPKVILFRPQREITSLRVGQTLTATSDALPGWVIPGHLERIAPTVDLTTGTVKVTAALDPNGKRIPSGILVKVVLTLETHDNALLIPKQALIHEGNQVYCFVVRNSIAKRLEVFPGFENEDSVEAGPGTDLLPTDLVVVVGADRIHDGDAVEIADE